MWASFLRGLVHRAHVYVLLPYRYCFSFFRLPHPPTHLDELLHGAWSDTLYVVLFLRTQPV